MFFSGGVKNSGGQRKTNGVTGGANLNSNKSRQQARKGKLKPENNCFVFCFVFLLW